MKIIYITILTTFMLAGGIAVIHSATTAPVIKSIGHTYDPKTGKYVNRAVRVDNAGGSPFMGAILAKLGIKINGGAIIDSYNSQDPRYSTLGQWDITKRKDGGNVGTIQSNVVAIVDEGSARVYGQLATGPNATIKMGGNASAGSLSWVSGGNRGVQAGWSRNDLNMIIPDSPALPTATYVNLPSEGKRTLSAGGGTAYYKASSTYHMVSDNYLLITNGTVVIDFQAGVKMDAKATIVIAPGSRLIAYLGTENSQLDGQGVVNPGGFATNCIIYGKNICKQIEINGGSAFVGYVYAPYADITLNGGSDTSGAMVGSSFQINGNMMFHYDESLAGPNTGSSIFRVISWKEVVP